MTTLVLGATGATGRHVVDHLLQQGETVIAIVRRELSPHAKLEQIQGTALSLPEATLSHLVGRCTKVVCCLGHNTTFKGIYGAPHYLVRDSLARVIQLSHSKPLKVVLMNSSGVKMAHERVSFGQSLVVGLIRALVPPHRDNEKAAAMLANTPANISYVIVRPDSLIDHHEVGEYQAHNAPIRSAIFDAGKISRINVAHFMCQLICQQSLWQQWQGQSPVLYNTDSQSVTTNA